jgi:hypothetical protein
VHLRARTRVDGEDLVTGELAGTFTEDTQPTADQVDAAISEAVAEVLSIFTSGEVPEASKVAAARAATLKAAYFVEVSYFPEQAEGATSSPYLQLRAMAESAMGTLIAAATTRDLFGSTVPS